jgi:hypothetical protein
MIWRIASTVWSDLRKSRLTRHSLMVPLLQDYALADTARCKN